MVAKCTLVLKDVDQAVNLLKSVQMTLFSLQRKINKQAYLMCSLMGNGIALPYFNILLHLLRKFT